MKPPLTHLLPLPDDPGDSRQQQEQQSMGNVQSSTGFMSLWFPLGTHSVSAGRSGKPAGQLSSVGLMVGEAEGLFVGEMVGEFVGEVVGLVVGEMVGLSVGDVVGREVTTPPPSTGLRVGSSELGAELETSEGLLLGAKLGVGLGAPVEGLGVGFAVGEIVACLFLPPPRVALPLGAGLPSMTGLGLGEPACLTRRLLRMVDASAKMGDCCANNKKVVNRNRREATTELRLG